MYLLSNHKIWRWGGKNLKLLKKVIKLMNQNFSKSKILHESSKLEYFDWGGDTNLGV